eukprot:GHVR01082200.1.p1 GENE.GHVR01082200.1~~GHVR01082200.1.p1  ORF type:complete len:153 (-),score=87.98 GHVR01082200.1:217-675(-)
MLDYLCCKRLDEFEVYTLWIQMVDTHTNTHKHTRTHTHAHAYTPTHIHCGYKWWTHTHTHKHTHTNTEIHRNTHTHIQVAAVHHIHSRGIIHRDLKLENFVLKETDTHTHTPKLTDFGFSCEKPNKMSKRFTFCGRCVCMCMCVVNENIYHV